MKKIITETLKGVKLILWWLWKRLKILTIESYLDLPWSLKLQRQHGYGDENSNGWKFQKEDILDNCGNFRTMDEHILTIVENF